jgi:hypothetical protein
VHAFEMEDTLALAELHFDGSQSFEIYFEEIENFSLVYASGKQYLEKHT